MGKSCMGNWELGEERKDFGTGQGMTDGMFLLRQLVRNKKSIGKNCKGHWRSGMSCL